MAGDWTVYWLTSILGLVGVGVVIGISFAIWRGVLGADFAMIGFRPLGFAYGEIRNVDIGRRVLSSAESWDAYLSMARLERRSA